ncbi:AA9 family lytic polysaccharide monooxygenase [Cercospora zeina]
MLRIFQTLDSAASILQETSLRSAYPPGPLEAILMGQLRLLVPNYVCLREVEAVLVNQSVDTFLIIEAMNSKLSIDNLVVCTSWTLPASLTASQLRRVYFTQVRWSELVDIEVFENYHVQKRCLDLSGPVSLLPLSFTATLTLAPSYSLTIKVNPRYLDAKMPAYARLVALLAAAAPALVSAHGHVSGIVSGGKWYSGTDPNWFYQGSKPNTAGWYANNQDNGFVEPSAFGNADIICHKGATPGTNSVPVAAGDTIDLQWNTWPDSHHGPVINYLAPVSGEFVSVDKSSLRFFKIKSGGLIDGSSPPGKWESDTLLANNFTGKVTIPSNIAPGNYVLRHEIIALHSAGQQNGAQSYPQCINLKVSGSGSAKPSGVAGTALYKANDAGILINIYQKLTSYTIPGPAAYSATTKRSHAREFES